MAILLLLCLTIQCPKAHTISILTMATPLPIHCSDCLSMLWEYHTLSAARWEYDAHSVRARLHADAERVSYSQRAALANYIIFFVTNWFYFSVLHCPKSIARKQSTCTPTAPPAGCASYLVSTSSSPHVFGWLLCFYLLFGGRLRPRCIFFFINVRQLIGRPNEVILSPPYVPPQ